MTPEQRQILERLALTLHRYSPERKTLEDVLATPLVWQPMKTAPRDGTMVVALCLEDYPRIVRCVPDLMPYPVWRCVVSDRFVAATHWMPLPTETPVVLEDEEDDDA